MGVEVLGLWLPNPAVRFNRPPFLHLSPPTRASLVTPASLSSPPPTIQIVGGKSTPSWQGSGNDVCGGGGEETDWYDFETDLYHWTKPLRPVQWYPGHIAKTEKELKEQLKLMDVVIEVRDARIPLSTTHPQMDAWLGNRKRILVLNREDMITKADRNAWATYFARQGIKVVFSNGQLGMGTMKLSRFAKSLAASVNVKRREKGLLPRPVGFLAQSSQYQSFVLKFAAKFTCLLHELGPLPALV